MYCGECGDEIKSSWSFCKSCGSKAVAQLAPEPETNVSENLESNASVGALGENIAPQKKSGLLWIIFGVAAGLALIALIATNSPGSGSPETQGTSTSLQSTEPKSENVNSKNTDSQIDFDSAVATVVTNCSPSPAWSKFERKNGTKLIYSVGVEGKTFSFTLTVNPGSNEIKISPEGDSPIKDDPFSMPKKDPWKCGVVTFDSSGTTITSANDGSAARKAADAAAEESAAKQTAADQAVRDQLAADSAAKELALNNRLAIHQDVARRWLSGCTSPTQNVSTVAIEFQRHLYGSTPLVDLDSIWLVGGEIYVLVKDLYYGESNIQILAQIFDPNANYLQIPNPWGCPNLNITG